MESEDCEISELKKLIHDVMDELNEDIREISYHHLKSILRKKFGVKCSLRDIRGIFCDGKYALSIGWGRGENYLHRIPPDFRRAENII
jgi:hypothetical protein